MRPSRPIRTTVAIAAAVALAAHVGWWYVPRARPESPEEGELARPFPVSRTARAAVWLPFPHQNLAPLDRRVGDLRVWIRGLAAAGGRESRLEIPSFGPFLVPPARELSAELGFDGGLTVTARLYPTVAALARAAGAVASNPWLAGGDVSSGGHPATVRWEGRDWTLARSPSSASSSSPSASTSSSSSSSSSSDETGDAARGRGSGGNLPGMGEGGAGVGASARSEVEEARRSGAGPSGGGAGVGAAAASDAAIGEARRAGAGRLGEASGPESFPSEEVFGLVWLGERVGPLPSAVYRVVPSSRVAGGIEILAGPASAATDAEAETETRSWPASLVDPAAGAPVGWWFERDARGRVRGVAVWEGASGVKEVPAIVVFRGGAAVGTEAGGAGPFEFELPGEGLLRLVGERAPETEVGGLRARALDRGSLERASAWVSALAPAFLVGGGAEVPTGGPVALAAAAPDRLSALAAGTARILRSVPLVDPADAARFERLATLLQPVAGCRLATLEVASSGAVRLVPCG